LNKFHKIKISNKIQITMKNLNKNHKQAFSLVEISIVILIIGLLIAGISKASDMIFDAELKSGRSLTKGAKVGRMANLALWLETTSAESILDNERFKDTTVTMWRDINPQSTSKFIFKISGTGAPKYIEEGQNNMPAIRFPNAADLLLPYSSEASTTVLPYPSTQIFSSGAYATIFVVLKPAATVTNLISFCEYTAAATPHVCSVGKEISLGLNSEGKLTFGFMNAAATTSTLTSTNAYASRNLIIVSAIKDTGSTANQKLFVNGADKFPHATPNTYATTNAFSGTFRVGGTASSGVEIYEIIVFSSNLSDADRYSVESYLGKKYSIPVTQNSAI
jgi:prepilin-type N-terminal cleavage/methylation domain-containing protein